MKEFKPLDGAQTAALLNKHVYELLLAGGRGGGKSEIGILDFISDVSRGYGEYLQGLVVRKTHSALKELIKKTETNFRHLIKSVNRSNSSPHITFKSGEILWFKQIKNLDDYDNSFHGKSFTWILVDELTLYNSDEVYKSLFSLLRSNYNSVFEDKIKSGEIEPLQLRIRATTNPYGAGKGWVKSRFNIGVASAGEVQEVRIAEGIYSSRMYLELSFFENTYIDIQAYKASIIESCNSRSQMLAWLFGDWDSDLFDGVFSQFYNESIHLLPVPSKINFGQNLSVEYLSAMDWGSAEPFSVLYGMRLRRSQEITINNVFGEEESFVVPKNSIIIYDEIYGGEPENPAKGLNLSPSELSDLIKERELELKQNNLLKGRINRVADSAIFANTRGKRERTIADLFKAKKINWKPCKKGAGSRATGKSLLIELLKNTMTGKEDSPHIYFTANCKYLLQNVMSLKQNARNPEDIDDTDPDHDYDALRYLISYKHSTL